MAYLFVLVLLVFVGFIIHNGPKDTRDSYVSNEYNAANVGVTRLYDADYDQTLAQEWTSALEKARDARVAVIGRRCERSLDNRRAA